MPVYLPIEFDCTIAIGRAGSQVLVSQLPIDVADLLCLNGDELDGWFGVPESPGVYTARVRTEWHIDEPETRILSFQKTSWKVIEEAECKSA